MRTWSSLWRRIQGRPSRQAWGWATHGPQGCLVGLTWQASGRVRVLDVQPFSPGDQGADSPGPHPPIPAAQGHKRPKLNMTLTTDQLVSGVLLLPAALAPQEWVSEVQLEVAQMLAQEPEEVQFDFRVDGQGDGLVQRVHWVGCLRAEIEACKRLARSTGWQLNSVEPAELAARRAAACLQGGLPSVLAQPWQDWQFQAPPGALAPELDPDRPVKGLADGVWAPVLKSDAGACLVACGAALKAWW